MFKPSQKSHRMLTLIIQSSIESLKYTWSCGGWINWSLSNTKSRHIEYVKKIFVKIFLIVTLLINLCYLFKHLYVWSYWWIQEGVYSIFNKLVFIFIFKITLCFQIYPPSLRTQQLHLRWKSLDSREYRMRRKKKAEMKKIQKKESIVCYF